MNIRSEDAKDVIKEVINTQKENRPWVEKLLIIAAAIIICFATFFIFRDVANKADARAIKAEAALEAYRQITINDAKTCPDQIRLAVEARDLMWETRFNALQDKYIKEYKDRADQAQKDIIRLSQKATNLERKTNEYKNRKQ